MKVTSLRKATLALTVITIVGKIIGYLRELFLAYFYGASSTIDSYEMAISIPEILFGWLLVVSVAYVPVYMESKQMSSADANQLSNQVFSWLILLGIVFGTVASILAPYIIKLVAPGFTGKIYYMTVRYFRITAFVAIFWPCANTMTAHLKCEKSFIRSALPSLFFSLSQIILIVISSKTSSYLLAYIPPISYFVFLICLLMSAVSVGYRPRLNFKISSYLRKMLLMMLPLFLSNCVKEINIFVDKIFASGLTEGSVSVITYASNLNTVIYSIFSVGILSVIYPLLSEKKVVSDKQGFTKTIIGGIDYLIIVFVPLSIGTLVMGKRLISILYERGKFSLDSTTAMYSVFSLYAAGLLFSALRELLNFVFYSLEKPKRIMWVGIITTLTNCIFNLLLVNRYGAVGLAAATSISIALTIPVLGFMLIKELPDILLRDSLILLLKTLVASSVMGVTLWGANLITEQFMHNALMIKLSVFAMTVVVGSLIYFNIMKLLRVRELSFITVKFNKIFTCKKRK